ncbi:hypothetical protein ACTXG7_02340 [Mycolicibacterium sp. Dal123E01]
MITLLRAPPRPFFLALVLAGSSTAATPESLAELIVPLQAAF